MNISPPNSNDTFFAGRLASVLHVDGKTETVKVRQLLLGEYEKALPFLKDEFAITAFLCSSAETPDKPLGKVWIETLQPESYEQVRAIAQEVNAKGFFSYAARHLEKERAEEERWARVSADMPPEFMERAIEFSRSRTTAPRPR